MSFPPCYNPVSAMTPPTSITVDDSLWPLVVIRLVGTPALPEFEKVLAKRTEILRRGTHLLLVDGMRSGMLPLEHRQRQVKWMGQHQELLRESMLGAAYATDSAFIRLTQSIVLHLETPAYPYVIVSRVDQAAEWSARKLEDSGLHEDAERVRYHFGLLRERVSG